MKKRDNEGTRENQRFYNTIKESPGFYDLQGITLQKEDCLSMAVEAVDLENDKLDDYKNLPGLSDKDMYVKALLAEKLSIPLFLIRHRRGIFYIDQVVRKELHEEKHIQHIQQYKFTEEEFIDWWYRKCGSAQNKEYKEKTNNYFQKSFFDKLLLKNGLSWILNIDGIYATIKSSSKRVDIRAIIEVRMTSEKYRLKVEDYTPEKYYKDDKRAWSTLKSIADKLNVPLILLTFSRYEDLNNINKVGAAVVTDTKETIKYKNDIAPKDNIFLDSYNLLEWLKLNIIK